ncbi:MAG: signal peptide peptidase SppA [Thermofilum sp. ex4484_15]|nr:MAG: signal peptide peptidase SppA [Thermofilum sp. ex4484_15]
MEAKSKGLSSRSIALLASGLIGAVLLASLVAPSLIKLPPFAHPCVAVIKIEGVLASSQDYTFLTPQVGVEEYIKLLDKAREDPHIKAVVLYVNSPGGTIWASEDLYFKVIELCKSKVTLAYVDGYCTSGAYMAILPVKKILTSNSSIIGSIGVCMVLVNFNGLLGKIGVKVLTFKSGRLKDIGSPFRNITDEDRRIYEDLIKGLFRVFKERVLKYRTNLVNKSEIFEGRPYTAYEARRLGLIDGVTTLNYAINLAKKMAGLPSNTPVEYLKPARKGLLSTILRSYIRLTGNYAPNIEILALWPPPSPTFTILELLTKG